MTIPSRVRSAVGLSDGDLVEVKVVGKRIVVTPRLAVDPSGPLVAESEYTPEQRRVIDARLAKAENGPFYGPFKDGADVASFLKKWQRKTKRAKQTKPR